MGITFDLAQLVLDHEIAAMILHSLDGIVVNDETLSVDVIREMGIGKDYMSHESTFKYMKSQSQAQIIDRRMREDWETAGNKDAYKRAHNKMIEILETYEPPPLPANVLSTIQSIVQEAEKELVP
jgi:trimethylamine--corrinoid protein Co-methyltransferase